MTASIKALYMGNGKLNKQTFTLNSGNTSLTNTGDWEIVNRSVVNFNKGNTGSAFITIQFSYICIGLSVFFPNIILDGNVLIDNNITGFGTILGNGILRQSMIGYQLRSNANDTIQVGLACKLVAGAVTIFQSDPPLIITLEEN